MYIPIHYIISINKLIDNKSLNLSLLIICLYSIIITLLLKNVQSEHNRRENNSHIFSNKIQFLLT